MSRLRPLHIPFVQGFSDEVDAKVLPDGVLQDLRNGRIDRGGSLRLRRGWRPVSLATVFDDGTDAGTPDGAVDLYSTDNGLVALVEDGGRLALQTLTSHSATTQWVHRDSQFLPPATNVRAVGAMPDFATEVSEVACALTSDATWGAVLAQVSSSAVLRVFRVADDSTRLYDLLSKTSGVRVLSLGSTFGFIDQTVASTIRLRTFNPSAATGGLSGSTTLVSSVSSTHLHAAVARETTPTRIHLVYVEAGEVTYRQFNTAGVEQGSGKQVVASGASAAWVASDDTTVHVVYQDATTDELSLLSFSATDPFTTAQGPTALHAGQAYEPLGVAIGYTPNHVDGALVWVAAEMPTSDHGVRTIRVTAAHAVSRSLYRSTHITTGWVTRGSYAGIGLVRGAEVGGLDAYYGDDDGPWLMHAHGLAADHNPEPWDPGQAPTGDVLTPWPRLSSATPAQSRASGEASTRQIGVHTWRVFDTARRRPGVSFAGALYVTGGVLTQYVGGSIAENGILRPVIRSLAESNDTGTIANGAYRYRLVITWTDADGRVHRSPVSDPVDITTTGANDTVTATCSVGRTLRRDADLDLSPTAELYRTEAGPGELFYRVAVESVTNNSDTVTIVDTSPDADIVDNPRLYTEGEFGEVSGALDVAMPSPSAFAAAVRDRLVLASAEPEYQFSQIAIPGEPASFTQPGFSGPVGLAYQDAVEGAITALAALDQAVILGTERAVFVASADGGPNLAGVGEFQSPARLPSDVGMPLPNSLVEDANGLWFLGDAAGERLYLLARGQSSPVAVLSARDRLAGGTVVGAAVDSRDDATCWALADGADSLLLTRHAQPPNPWAAHELPFTPHALVAHGGGLYAIDTDGGVWTNDAEVFGDGTSGATAVALQLATPDVQVFGQAGHGRLAVIEVLGEFQTAATLLLEISYDMGLTWDSIGTAHTVTGLTAGQAFQRQWRPSRQRAGKFRLRVTMTPSSTTAEGCRLTGLSLYYRPATGPTRLGAAKRR